MTSARKSASVNRSLNCGSRIPKKTCAPLARTTVAPLSKSHVNAVLKEHRLHAPYRIIPRERAGSSQIATHQRATPTVKRTLETFLTFRLGYEAGCDPNHLPS